MTDHAYVRTYVVGLPPPPVPQAGFCLARSLARSTHPSAYMHRTSMGRMGRRRAGEGRRRREGGRNQLGRQTGRQAGTNVADDWKTGAGGRQTRWIAKGEGRSSFVV
eukprot:GHVU01142331.1.p2 GENE.GHVU01142331.1~~GHVU01142331.1.p2  ORF type:complete len:107 (+),score=7.19 GHVU01142331.1:29-349(+)